MTKITEKQAKELAKEYNSRINHYKKSLDATVPDVIAMSSTSDPFYMTKGKILKAYWAKDTLETIIIPHLRRIGVGNTHLRDIHYTLTSEDYRTWDGEKYLNTEKHWNDLIQAFSVARYLEIIDYRYIRDNKNQLNQRTTYSDSSNLEDAVQEAKENIDTESIIEEVFIKPFKYLLNAWAFQPVHVEIWSEKDLALIEKISRKYNINTMIGEGETSVTMVFELVLDRLREANRPVRIAYISDCDVVGSNMVKAMSRKVEYLLDRKNIDLDVKIIPLMVTPEQVQELNLPPIPMKLSKSKGYETRKENWLNSRGMTGAVEINALHAQHPDFFERTLTDFIESYLDVDKWNEVIHYRRKIPELIREAIDGDLLDLTSFYDILDEIDWDSITSIHEKKIDEIKSMPFDFQSNDSRFTWLLDTERAYLAQLRLYKQYDNGDLE